MQYMKINSFFGRRTCCSRWKKHWCCRKVERIDALCAHSDRLMKSLLTSSDFESAYSWSSLASTLAPSTPIFLTIDWVRWLKFQRLFLTSSLLKTVKLVMSGKGNRFVGSVESVSSNFRSLVPELEHQCFGKESFLFHDGKNVRVTHCDAHLPISRATAVLKKHLPRAESFLLEVERTRSLNTQWEYSRRVPQRWWIDFVLGCVVQVVLEGKRFQFLALTSDICRLFPLHVA